MLELPTELAELVAGLEDTGFKRIDERYDPSAFGNGLLELADPEGRRVRLVLDRGLWGVDVDLGSSWRDVYRTALVLTRRPYRQRALSHDEQASYTLEVLARLPTDRDGQLRLDQRVDALQSQIWEARHGSPDRASGTN